MHEHITLLAKRVYCANPACAKFLSTAVVKCDTKLDGSGNATAATCAACSTQTCLKCKSKHHAGHICADSDPTSELSAMPTYSSRMRIKQCPQCSTLIELSKDCNHMTCPQCSTSSAGSVYCLGTAFTARLPIIFKKPARCRIPVLAAVVQRSAIRSVGMTQKASSATSVASTSTPVLIVTTMIASRTSVSLTNNMHACIRRRCEPGSKPKSQTLKLDLKCARLY
jgi:hypothetical protein